MSDTPQFRNRFGEVYADRLVLYSYDVGADVPKGESFALTSVQKVGARVEHARNAVVDPSGRFGHGRFFIIGLVMLAAAGAVFAAWHWATARWPALVVAGNLFPIFFAMLAGVGVGILFYPYRILLTLRDRRLPSTRLGTLKEARAFIAAVRTAKHGGRTTLG